MKINDVRKKLTVHSTKEYRRRPLAAITHIAIHHSLTKEGSAEAFANYHVNHLGWPGIAYHYVIKKDGTIEWCNDLAVISYHVGDSNGFSVGICLVGDFRSEEPTEKQKESLRWLHSHLIEQLPKHQKTLGHNEFPGYSWKQCPMFDYKKVLEEDKMSEDHKPSSWAAKSMEKAVNFEYAPGKFLTDGTKPKEPMSFERFITIIDRLGLMDKK